MHLNVRSIVYLASSESGDIMQRARIRTIAAIAAGALVAAGAEVFAAVPRPPTLEDVYFAIEARRAAEAGLAPEVPA